MSNGERFIKLYPKMLEWGWYKDKNTKILFLHCLLKANWKAGEWRGIKYERGQFITSLASLAAETGLSISEIRTAFLHLEMTNELTSKSTSKYRIVTVVSYDKYQSFDKVNDNEIAESSQSLSNRYRIIEYNITSSSLNNSNELYKDSDVRPSFDEEPSISINQETDSVAKPTEKPKTRFNDEIQQVVDAWNSLADVGVKPITKMAADTKRMQSLVARIRQYGIDDVIKAIDRIRRSKFLIGENHRGWQISFDWFVKPNNFPKVMEGNYDDQTERDDDIFERLK